MAIQAKMTEPVIFTIGKETWIKLDQQAFKLEVSCVAEGLAILFASYFIFNVKYPAELNLVYGLFERVICLKKEMRTKSAKSDELYWPLALDSCNPNTQHNQ